MAVLSAIMRLLVATIIAFVFSMHAVGLEIYFSCMAKDVAHGIHIAGVFSIVS
jgi:hypothetical protein